MARSTPSRSLRKRTASGHRCELFENQHALHRSQTGYYADIAKIAAALFESLLINHPFMNGEARGVLRDGRISANEWMAIAVNADAAHAFLIGLLERVECKFDKPPE